MFYTKLGLRNLVLLCIAGIASLWLLGATAIQTNSTSPSTREGVEIERFFKAAKAFQEFNSHERQKNEPKDEVRAYFYYWNMALAFATLEEGERATAFKRPEAKKLPFGILQKNGELRKETLAGEPLATIESVENFNHSIRASLGNPEIFLALAEFPSSECESISREVESSLRKKRCFVIIK